MALRVAINGFGRIGRNLFRAAKKNNLDIDFVAVNDITDTQTLALLLKYDSVHGRYNGTVEASDDGLLVDGDEVKVLSERDPANLPWKDLDVDIVVESTGFFTGRDDAAKHLTAGARKVIISAPAKNEDITIVLGSNEDQYDPASHDVISNASCTTNSVVPMAKVLHETFGIERGLMTTIHAYTGDQRIHHAPHKDPRRARAAGVSIIPTTTGAAKAATLALPELEGRLDGLALRVPIPDGSLTDLTCVLEREVTKEEINEAFEKAADGPLRGILEYSEDPLVSIDIVGNPHSCILDAKSTMATGRACHLRASSIQALRSEARTLVASMTVLSGLIKTTPWPKASVPAGAFSSPQQVLGKVSRVKIMANEPILDSRLAGEGAGLTVRLEPGKRAVAVRVDEIIGVSGFIVPDDRVDVILTTTPAGGNQDAKISKIVLQNKRVLSVAQSTEQKDGKPQVARSITLEVTPEEAEKLSLASQEGPIVLALRA